MDDVHRRALPSGLQLSELDPGFRDEPHALLDLLRHQAPRYMDPCSNGTRLFLTRHSDIRAALCDASLTRDAEKAPTRSRRNAASGTLLSMEGAAHRAGRKLIGRAFDARAVAARRGHVEAVVDTLLDAIERKQCFDGIADFAAPLPLLVIADILGLPCSDIASLRTWCEDAGVLTMLPSRTEDEDRRLATASRALGSYLVEGIEARRATPGDDLLSHLIATDIDGRRLCNEEIAPLCLLLLVAGNLTTTDVIGNAIVLFLRHPDQRALLRDKPELIGSAVEEVLRFDPPVSAVGRHTAGPSEVLGCGLPAGGTVKASLIAANRDPEVFNDPHAFRIERPADGHVAFGGGTHTCPGAALARLEISVALQRLFTRFPHLKLNAPPQRKVTYGFRGFGELLLRTS